MQIVKEKLETEEVLEKKINNLIKYNKSNYFNEPFKLIPIIDKFKIAYYGLIKCLEDLIKMCI